MSESANACAEAGPLVEAVMLRLRLLAGENPRAYTDLVWACHDRSHPVADPAALAGLIESADEAGRVVIHDSVRRIVNEAHGTGSPLAGEQR